VKRKVVTERVPMLMVYKQNGKIYLDINEDEALAFEVYGFLSLYLNRLEESLTSSIEIGDD
jgi:hypothetical protein